ncbi:MAG: ABC transporter permease subunit [Roseburia hominis]
MRRLRILTLKIGWIGILFAIVIGLFCALIRHYKVPVLSTIAGGYIELFRNTPLLVQLFFYILFAEIGNIHWSNFAEC